MAETNVTPHPVAEHLAPGAAPARSPSARSGTSAEGAPDGWTSGPAVATMEEMSKHASEAFDAPSTSPLRLRLPAVEPENAPELVDNDELRSPISQEDQEEYDRLEGLERLREDRAESIASAANAASCLSLAPVNLARGRDLQQAFERARPADEIAEGLLEQLVSAETSVAMQLLDTEAALAALLAGTVTDPRLGLEVAKLLREVIGLSDAVRRRTEGSLQAAAGLRAQRSFIEAQRR